MKVCFSTFVTNYAGTTGFVVTQDEITKEKKLRVSSLRSITEAEEHSVRYVAEHGGTLPLPELKRLVEALESKS